MTADTQRWIRPCTLVYLVLVGLTLVTWVAGRLGLQGMGVTFFVLGLALLKGQLIGDGFMGLRHVRGFWRWAILTWLVGVGALVGVAFFLSSGLH